jgi:hypothetical protein
MMTLADMIGLVANIIVELLLVMVHCVVTAGLLWNTIVVDPEGTSQSVVLLVAERFGDTTDDTVVAVYEEVVE